MGTDKLQKIQKAYQEDEKFKEYVNAYAQCRQISVKSAMEHEVVYQVLLDRKSRGR